MLVLTGLRSAPGACEFFCKASHIFWLFEPYSLDQLANAAVAEAALPRCE